MKRDADEIGGPLDKLVFAESCVRKAVSWGTSAHYLMAVAEMRTNVTDGPNKNGKDVGPFALSLSEWTFYIGLQDYDLGMTADDIVNWRSQCSVFAVMILTAQQNIANLIGSQPTFSQLYLAQILGSKAMAAAISNPGQAISEVVASSPPDGFKSEGVDQTQIVERYTDLLKDATGQVVLQRIDSALQQALDATNPFITKVAGDTIDTAAVRCGAAPGPPWRLGVRDRRSGSWPRRSGGDDSRLRRSRIRGQKRLWSLRKAYHRLRGPHLQKVHQSCLRPVEFPAVLPLQEEGGARMAGEQQEPGHGVADADDRHGVKP